MADTKLVIEQDERGGAKVQAELKGTNAALQNNAAALDRASQASARFDAEAGNATSSLGSLKGGALLVADAVANLAGKAAAAAAQIAAFAAEGAKAADIGRSYAQLGAAAASMSALKEATAGAVDETSLQRFAMQAEAIGLTAAQAEAAARSVTVLASQQGRAAEIAAIMTNSLKGSPEALRELGVVIDFSEKRFAGLSEAQKKLTVALELGKQATAEQLAALDSQTLSMAATKTAYDDLLSNAQIFAAELVRDSGAQKAFADAMAVGQRLLAENKDAIAGIVSAGVTLAEVVGGQLVEQFSTWASVLGTTLQIVGPFVEILADGVKMVNDLTASVRTAAIDFLGLSTNTRSVADDFAAFVGQIDEVKDSLAKVNDEARELPKAFDLANPATKETIDNWEMAIRQGGDLSMVIADIAAQSKGLEGANADLAELFNRFDGVELVADNYERLDRVFAGVEDKFENAGKETPKRTAAAKKDMDEWRRFIERTMFSLTGYSPQRFWREWQEAADDFEKRRLAIDKALTSSAKRAAADQRQIEKTRAAEGYAALRESVAAVAQAAKDEAAARLSARDAIKSATLDTVAAVGSETAAFLGGGWARAGFEAAFQTGLGLAELFTPPAFGVNRFLAAGQLLVAQAFAEANGAGGKGGGSAASSSAPRAAAAPTAMVRRPESSSGSSEQGKIVQLWSDLGMWGEMAIEGVNRVTKRNGKKIDRRSIGVGGRNSFG